MCNNSKCTKCNKNDESAKKCSCKCNPCKCKDCKCVKKEECKQGPRGFRGCRGLTGPAGPIGPTGPIGPVTVFVTRPEPTVNIGNTNVVIASLNLPAGSYILTSSLDLISEPIPDSIVPFISYSTNPTRILSTSISAQLFNIVYSITDVATLNVPTQVDLIVSNNGTPGMTARNIVMTATEVTTVVSQ